MIRLTVAFHTGCLNTIIIYTTRVYNIIDLQTALDIEYYSLLGDKKKCN